MGNVQPATWLGDRKTFKQCSLKNASRARSVRPRLPIPICGGKRFVGLGVARAEYEIVIISFLPPGISHFDALDHGEDDADSHYSDKHAPQCGGMPDKFLRRESGEDAVSAITTKSEKVA